LLSKSIEKKLEKSFIALPSALGPRAGFLGKRLATVDASILEVVLVVK